MPPGDCDLCTYLLGCVSTAVNRQIKALALLTEAVIDNPDNEANIVALNRNLEIVSLTRKEAVERYGSHMLTHSAKVLTAGQSQLL